MNIYQKFNKSKYLFKRFKGNVLNEIDEIKKSDGTPLKVLHHFGEMQKNII